MDEDLQEDRSGLLIKFIMSIPRYNVQALLLIVITNMDYFWVPQFIKSAEKKKTFIFVHQ